MKQHDSNAFMKLFNYSSLPLIGQKTNVLVYKYIDRLEAEVNSIEVLKTK